MIQIRCCGCGHQDEALAFWTEKVGFEVRHDATVPEMGNFRSAAGRGKGGYRHRADGHSGATGRTTRHGQQVAELTANGARSSTTDDEGGRRPEAVASSSPRKLTPAALRHSRVPVTRPAHMQARAVDLDRPRRAEPQARRT